MLSVIHNFSRAKGFVLQDLHHLLMMPWNEGEEDPKPGSCSGWVTAERGVSPRIPERQTPGGSSAAGKEQGAQTQN